MKRRLKFDALIDRKHEKISLTRTPQINILTNHNICG